MFQAQKEKQQAAGQGAKGTVKKADSGVSTHIIRVMDLPGEKSIVYTLARVHSKNFTDIEKM